MKNKIFIYNDEGVHFGTFVQTIDTLTQYFNHQCNIIPINAEEIINGSWRNEAIMLVIPGGADRAYAARLNGPGNQMIREFVDQGGTYLGICAGAYYASSEIEFDRGGELEVIGSRELALFPGKSIGPAISFYDYNSNAGASAASISCSLLSGSRLMNLYHHGGGYFENAEQYSNVEVIGNYAEADQNSSAIIRVNYGEGRAILSGVHFEIDPFSQRANVYDSEEAQHLIEELQLSNHHREALIALLFKDIPCFFPYTDFSEF